VEVESRVYERFSMQQVLSSSSINGVGFEEHTCKCD